MEEMQVVPNKGGGISVYHSISKNFTSLDALIGLGLNPQDMSREALYRHFLGWGESHVRVKSTYDALVARGFPIHAINPVVNERIEPALQYECVD